MTSANADKLLDPEKQLLNSASLSTTARPDDIRLKKVDTKSTIMARMQYFSFALLLLVTLIVTFTSALQPRAQPIEVSAEDKAFQELLTSVDPTSLHDVLHEHLAEKYQHGVYQEDKAAMEVVHQSNAEVAHSLLELAKRQSNSTSTSPPPSTSDTTTPTTSSNTPTTTPTTSASVAPTTSTPTQTSATVAPTTSTPDSQTPTQSQSQTQNSQVQSSTQKTSDQTTPATQSSSTSPSAVQSTSSNAQQSSNGAVTTSKSGTPTTGKSTPTSARGSVTQQTIYTTTLADGAVSTITSVTIVPANQADSTSGSATKSGTNASLQTNVAKSNSLNLGFGGVLGAVGLVFIGAL